MYECTYTKFLCNMAIVWQLIIHHYYFHWTIESNMSINTIIQSFNQKEKCTLTEIYKSKFCLKIIIYIFNRCSQGLGSTVDHFVKTLLHFCLDRANPKTRRRTNGAGANRQRTVTIPRHHRTTAATLVAKRRSGKSAKPRRKRLVTSYDT